MTHLFSESARYHSLDFFLRSRYTERVCFLRFPNTNIEFVFVVTGNQMVWLAFLSNNRLCRLSRSLSAFRVFYFPLRIHERGVCFSPMCSCVVDLFIFIFLFIYILFWRWVVLERQKCVFAIEFLAISRYIFYFLKVQPVRLVVYFYQI